MICTANFGSSIIQSENIVRHHILAFLVARFVWLFVASLWRATLRQTGICYFTQSLCYFPIVWILTTWKHSLLNIFLKLFILLPAGPFRNGSDRHNRRFSNKRYWWFIPPDYDNVSAPLEPMEEMTSNKDAQIYQILYLVNVYAQQKILKLI